MTPDLTPIPDPEPRGEAAGAELRPDSRLDEPRSPAPTGARDAPDPEFLRLARAH